MATTNNPIKKVYIAGPMTGYKDFNYPAFNTVANILRGWGYHVENPAENSHPEGTEWEGYMKVAIRQMLTCDMVFLLDGWQKSKGANIECHLAIELGLSVVQFNDVVTLYNQRCKAI